LNELSQKHRKSIRTLRKYFDSHCPCTGEVVSCSSPLCISIDATFFGRSYGILVARAEKKNLLWKEIAGEKIQYYREILESLEGAGFVFSAFVIDGRRGVRHLLEQKYPLIPIQLFQFHQIQTITKYISRKPKLLAGKELRFLSLTLTKTNKEVFSKALEEWNERWKDFLKERTVNQETERWHYTHKKLRSAFFSLRNNLPWLFTYQDFPKLKIPNTTNSCDGSFAHWKAKVKLHRGLSKERRKKMIDYFLENS